MACDPPYSPNDVVTTLSSWHKLLKTNGISPTHVFDGCRHPMNSITHMHRHNSKLKVENALKQFYELVETPNQVASAEDHYEAMKKRKFMPTPNN